MPTVVSAAKDKRTTVIGAIVAFLSALVPTFINDPDLATKIVQSIGALAGVVLVIGAGDRTNDDVNLAAKTGKSS